MTQAEQRLGALAALERRYDGPIPEPLKRIALLGSAERWLQIEADSQAEFFASLIRGQLDAIRRSGHDGPIPAHLHADLALYRRRRRWWRREMAKLSAADAP